MGLLTRSEEQSGVERLREALAEPRETLDLHAVAAEPDLDDNVVDTAVVPMDVYDGDEHYGTTTLEFEIRDDRGEVYFKDFAAACGGLENIEGTRFDEVMLDLFGNVNIMWQSETVEPGANYEDDDE